MDYATSSDPILRFAFWAGALAMLLTLAIIMQIVMMRYLLLRREARRRRFLAIWLPLMVQSLVETPKKLPRVAKADRLTFLSLWIHLQESLRGNMKDGLINLARTADMGQAAHRAISRRGMAQRLLAVIALGHLRQKTDWSVLEKLLQEPNALLSIAAARSMMQINPEAAISRFIPLLITRTDWPPVRVAMILREAGPDLVSQPLVDLLKRASPEQLPELIPFLEQAHDDVIAEFARGFIDVNTDPPVIAAFLRVMKSPQDLDMVRRQVVHTDWRVRVQAALALGRMGLVEDRRLLIHLLADQQWWVRYRAAQALSQLPFVDLDYLRGIQLQQSDRYAHDILDQVMEEKV
ncbi:MAG: HEAT repeat domain-containing protein [Pseudomonadota bacterium]